MIKRFLYGVRYLRLLMRKRIHCEGKVIVQNGVKIFVEQGAKLVFGEQVLLKNNTVIYVKRNAILEIGDRTSLGHHNEISVGKDIRIGDDNIFAPYVYVSDSNHEYNDPNELIKKQGMKISKVQIGSNNWIGRSAMLLSGSSILNGCVIAAGAVVNKSFSDNNFIIAGNPAKIIKSRIE